MNNLSEEEKKAIERIDNSYDYNTGWVEADVKDWNIITNLIKKQQKEIEELKENYIRLQNTEAIQDIYIKKDKIKAKIEEYKRIGEKEIEVDTLQKLLEE